MLTEDYNVHGFIHVQYTDGAVMGSNDQTAKSFERQLGWTHKQKTKWILYT